MKVSPFLQYNVCKLGEGVKLPDASRNYCTFNEKRADFIAGFNDEALQPVDVFLKTAKTEEQVLDGLYVLNKIADKNPEGVAKLYPSLSTFNCTQSPNIMSLLSGIYRKTLVPDAFGPLNRMLYNQITCPNSPYFDVTEEIGGAILEYISKFKS